MEYSVLLKKPFSQAEVARQLAAWPSSRLLFSFGGSSVFSSFLLNQQPLSLLPGLAAGIGLGVRKAPVYEDANMAIYEKSGKGGSQTDYYSIGAGQVLVCDHLTKAAYWHWVGPAAQEGVTQQDLAAAAKELGIELELMTAIARQESHGGGFFADGQPKILFERHKMYAHLKADGFDAKTLAKNNPDIVNPAQGGYGKESAQYGKLARARALDESAALQSASWGRYQVLGENYADLYQTPQAMEKAMRASEKEQLAFFVAFLRKKGGGKLIAALKAHQWETVAFYYNGKYWKTINPNYATNIQKYYEEEVKKKPK